MTFKKDLSDLINVYSIDTRINMSDDQIADLLVNVLDCLTEEETTREINSAIEPLTPSEALYAFSGWLSSRGERTTFSAQHSASPIAERIKEFCELYNLEDPTNGWERKLKQNPREKKQLQPIGPVIMKILRTLVKEK